MDKIKKTIKGLDLVSSIIPDYSLGRSWGLSDEETERKATNGVYAARDLLENFLGISP